MNVSVDKQETDVKSLDCGSVNADGYLCEGAADVIDSIIKNGAIAFENGDKIVFKKTVPFVYSTS